MDTNGDDAMSATVMTEDVIFTQRMLCSAGCYSGPADGAWSKALDEANARFEAMSSTLAAVHGTFDVRTERHIRTLHPRAQEAARRLLVTLRKAGFDARVISGTRTYAEQAALYDIGRTGDGKRPVTNAKAGHSNHNFGVAWDIGLFDNGVHLTTEGPYRNAGLLCPTDIEWGGDWFTFPDPPHYQLYLRKPLAEIRYCFEQGRPFATA
jgi:peptidoglycan LD-endopeptidase CwlK